MTEDIKTKLCFVATVPDVLFSFMKSHIQAAGKEMDVAMISSSQRSRLLNGMDAQFIAMDIRRKISLWADLRALVQLILFFHREKFDLVHSIMPKTGLLGMLAAWTCGVPCRVHTFTGQVWARKRGLKRVILKCFDRLIVLFATHIIVDSPSQRDFLESEKIIPRGLAMVIGSGSICGVDKARFHPNPLLRKTVRDELGISANQVLVLYLGRLNTNKGVLDLAHAFMKINLSRKDVRLVLVGNEDDVAFAQIEEICAIHSSSLRKIAFTDSPERYMAAADILCLPSYREGFGQVIIEAAACGVPAVASRIYGITDAVDEGNTGLLFPAGDIDALESALLKMINKPALRKKMGRLASRRAFKYFDSEVITAQQIRIYKEALAR